MAFAHEFQSLKKSLVKHFQREAFNKFIEHWRYIEITPVMSDIYVDRIKCSMHMFPFFQYWCSVCYARHQCSQVVSLATVRVLLMFQHGTCLTSQLHYYSQMDQLVTYLVLPKDADEVIKTACGW